MKRSNEFYEVNVRLASLENEKDSYLQRYLQTNLGLRAVLSCMSFHNCKDCNSLGCSLSTCYIYVKYWKCYQKKFENHV